MKNKKNRGFTLIEMIVVIAIIGVLATLMVYSVSGIRKNSVDTRRKANLENVRGAANMYFSIKNSWPTDNTWTALLSTLSSEGLITDNIPKDEDGDDADDYTACQCSTNCPSDTCSATAQIRICATCVVANGEGCTDSKYCLEIK